MSTTASAATAPRSGGVFGRMARCLSVSVLTTLLSLVTLALLVGWWGTTAWLANVIATAVGTVPSYVLNRRWVWGRDGSGDIWREVVPFWALSFSGLVLSTAAVATAAAWASSIDLFGPTRTAVLLLANVGSFAVLWVGQFLVLDRALSARRSRGQATGVWTVCQSRAVRYGWKVSLIVRQSSIVFGRWSSYSPGSPPSRDQVP